MSDELRDLQRWYQGQCDGEWEHEYGVRIATLDNPGWSIEIDLAETELQDRPFVPIRDMDSANAWVMCRVADGRFLGDGGSLMLGRMLRVFLDWAREGAGGESAAPGV
jgi:hypothetical protein